ncbi:MAG TPA: DUF3299 domain-containing protein [Burkholderiales bacterium]|nr:DUF3299 domain-containing protein [Burkholderiales bacterium]
MKATDARRHLGAALFLGVVALAAQAQEVVPWKTFAQVEMTRSSDRIVPRFSEMLAALDQREVKVQGFMLPLDMGEKHAFFILSAVPPTCSFCMPGGPEAVVEVRAKRPLAYTDNAVTVTGKLSVLKDDPTGVFYRLTEAVPAK